MLHIKIDPSSILIPIWAEFDCAGRARVACQPGALSNRYAPKAMPYEDNAQVIVPGKTRRYRNWGRRRRGALRYSRILQTADRRVAKSARAVARAIANPLSPRHKAERAPARMGRMNP